MAKFDYGKFFGAITPLADALRESPTRFWEPTREDFERPHDYVLYLGCNVLRTVHLAEAMVAVLRAMGVDFITLGGPANCCGIVHHREGDAAASAHLTGHTFGNFRKARPKAVLTYCPSCHSHFDEQLPGEFGFDLPYQHVTEFIAQRVAGLEFKRSLGRRIALHAHVGPAQQRADTAHTLTILRAIPGLDVVELEADERWGLACSPSQIAMSGRAEFESNVGALYAQARDQGCDALVAVYHSCYRELLPFEARHGLELLNYVELLAQALGLGPFEARYKTFKLAQDPAAAYAAVAPRAAERGANLKRLRDSVQQHFAPPAASPTPPSAPKPIQPE